MFAIPPLTTSRRWHKAQASERDWWQSRAADMDLDFYAAFAQALRRELDGILTLTPDTRILEIGSGAAGILTHLSESNYRHAVDPTGGFLRFHRTLQRLPRSGRAIPYRGRRKTRLPGQPLRLDHHGQCPRPLRRSSAGPH